MRSQFAPLGTHALAMLAGFGILAALRMLPRFPVAALGAVGLAYLAGLSTVLIIGLTALTLGLPFGLVPFAVTAGVLAAGGFAFERLRPPRSSEGPCEGLEPQPARRIETVVAALLALAAGGVALIWGWAAIKAPIAGDAYTIWARKALILHYEGGLAPNFGGHGVPLPDYPLGVPLWESLQFAAAGRVDHQGIPFHLWAWVPAFGLAAGFLAVRSLMRPALAVCVLVLPFALAALWGQAVSGYTDVAVAVLFGLGALLLGLWSASGDPARLVLAVLVLGAAGNVKNEGAMSAAIALAAAGAVVLASRDWRGLRHLLLGTLGFALAVLPWRLWAAANHFESYLPLADGLSPAYLADRTERIAPAIAALNTQLAAWGWVVPLAIAAAVVGVLGREERRAAGFYLLTGLGFYAVLVWTYWISPQDLAWHLETSAGRVIVSLVFVALAALVHLVGGTRAAGAGAR